MYYLSEIFAKQIFVNQSRAKQIRVTQGLSMYS